MDLTLAANEFSIGQLGLIDSDTQEAVSASFSNQAFSSTDDGIFTAGQAPPLTPDTPVDPNLVKASGVSAGEAQLNFQATASYIDKFGNSKQKNLSGSVKVTVTAVQQEQNVSLVVNFGSVQPQ